MPNVMPMCPNKSKGVTPDIVILSISGNWGLSDVGQVMNYDSESMN
jgi:hypothetical protein